MSGYFFRSGFTAIIFHLCSVVLMASAQGPSLSSTAPYDIEIGIGSSIFRSRQELIEDLCLVISTIEAEGTTLTPKQGVKKLQGELWQEFISAGGTELQTMIDTLRFGWSGQDGSAVLRADFQAVNQKDVHHYLAGVLLSYGWKSPTSGVYQHQAMELKIESDRLLLTSPGANVRNFSGAGFKGDLFLQIMGGKHTQYGALAKNEMARSMLQWVLKWKGHEFEVRARFAEPDSLAYAHSNVRMGLDAVNALKSSKVGPAGRLDFYRYMRRALAERYFRALLLSAELEVEEQDLVVRLPKIGLVQDFFYKLMPLVVTEGLLEAASSPGAESMFAQFRKSLPAAAGSGPCPKTMQMSRQALEFYNLDHGSKKNVEEVQRDLFEQGYLPEDLECDGKKVKSEIKLKTSTDGQIIF